MLAQTNKGFDGSIKALQRTGASRFAQRQIQRHRRLASVADFRVGRSLGSPYLEHFQISPHDWCELFAGGFRFLVRDMKSTLRARLLTDWHCGLLVVLEYRATLWTVAVMECSHDSMQATRSLYDYVRAHHPVGANLGSLVG